MQINVTLAKDFERALEALKEKYGTDFEDINSLDEDHLGYTTFINKFKSTKTVADVSADASANVTKKDIPTLRSEMSKPMEKMLSYNKIFMEIKKKYGLRMAKKWFELEWTKALYMHDANTATFVHYCFAYDLKDVAERGLFYLEDNKGEQPPKHLETFVDFVKEFISFTSNRSSGACGLPNLIPYLFYFWNKDVESGHYPRCQTPEQFAKSEIQRLVYAMNQPYTRDGIQTAFTNTSIFDESYFDAIFGGMEFPDGTFAMDYKDQIIQFEKWFAEETTKIRLKEKFTFPVNSFSLLVDSKTGKFVNEDFAKWACEHNRQMLDSNFFIDDTVTSLSNCCRLKSNIKDLGYFNSIGGTSLKVGSVKVSTINLARIAYEAQGNEKKYLEILKDRLNTNMHALDIVRDIIIRNVEKGLLPNFQKGIVDFEHLYNTVGINGIYETMKTFGYTYQDEFGYTFYKQEALDFGQKIFELIKQDTKAWGEGRSYMTNVEQVPAESAAVKFIKADTLLYPEQVVEDLPLYGNQWIPLGIKSTIQERVRICSAFDKFCDGGSIMHINVDKPFTTEEQAWKMLNYVKDAGVTYFAFNGKIAECKNGHSFYGDICPECHEPKCAEYTRVVGFMTKTATWSNTRKEEFKLREWMDLNKE